MGFIHIVSREKQPYDRGYALGTQIKKLVKANVGIYMRSFLHNGLTRQSVLTKARKFIPIIQKHDEEMFQEIRGLAESTSSKLEEILALNVRYELIWGSWAECTSIALQPEASSNKHILVGKNWDWIDSVMHSCHTWHVTRPNKPDVLCFTEAGVVAPRFGMNSTGLGLCGNGLVSSEDGMQKGATNYMILRRILNSTSMSDALELIANVQRAGSANYLICHKEGEALDVETSPNRLGYVYPTHGLLIHTNHFIGLTLDDLGPKRFPDTIVRYARCLRLMRQFGRNISSADIQTVFKDHFNYPNSICRHPDESKPREEKMQTNSSVIMDLTEQSMWLTKGNPCQSDYERLTLKRETASRTVSERQMR